VTETTARQTHASVEYLRRHAGLYQDLHTAKQYRMQLHVATNDQSLSHAGPRDVNGAAELQTAWLGGVKVIIVVVPEPVLADDVGNRCPHAAEVT